MISTLTIITALAIMAYSSVKSNIVFRTMAFFISLSLIASMIYESKEDLVIVMINILFMLILVASSHKNYRSKQ